MMGELLVGPWSKSSVLLRRVREITAAVITRDKCVSCTPEHTCEYHDGFEDGMLFVLNELDAADDLDDC